MHYAYFMHRTACAETGETIMSEERNNRATAMEADRKAAGLSYRQLGQKAGVSDGNIRDAVKGRKDMGDGSWAKIAAALPGGALAARLAEAGIDIPEPSADAEAHAVRQDEASGGIILLAHNELSPGDNYRKTFAQEELLQLAESIAAQGLLQNIVARPMPGADEGASPSVLRPARLVAGERRWRAINELIKQGRWNGAERNIPVRLQALEDDEARALALIENLQRQEVPVLEEAEGFKALTAMGWNTDRIADACHIARRTVQDRLQLFERLKPVAREALQAGQITIEQARAIISTPIEAEQNELVTCAVRNGFNAASLRDRAKRGKVMVGKAAFDLKQYKGEFIGSGPDRVFADTEAFLELQWAEARRQADELRDSGRFKSVTLVEDGEGGLDYSTHRRLFEDDVTDEYAPQIDVFVSVCRWHHFIEIEYGCIHSSSEADGDTEERAERAEIERKEANKKRMEEAHEAARWQCDMIAACTARPADYLRREILITLNNTEAAWHGPYLSGDPEITPAVLAVLRVATARHFTLDDMDDEQPLDEIPENEPLGYLTTADSDWLRTWLDEQPDAEIFRLYVALCVARNRLWPGITLDAETLHLSARLGVSAPEHLWPEELRAPGEEEEGEEDAA